MASFKLSCITTETPERLSKTFSLGSDGKLVLCPGGQLVRGTYVPLETSGPVHFARLLAGLKPSQALLFGRAGDQRQPIASRATAQPGDLTRTRSCFDWPGGPGIGMVDCDLEPGAPALTPEELWADLVQACPAIANAPAVQGFSGGGYIYNGQTGEELRGPGGQRVYLFVEDARDIERAGKALYEHLWLHGHGRFDVSKSGRLLDRTVIDRAVWSPERLDFASGAACEAPLVQKRPAFIVRNAGAEPLNTVAAIPDLTPDESARVAVLRAEARKAKTALATEAKSLWVAERVREYRERRPDVSAEDMPDAALESQFRRAVEDGELFGDFVLHLHGGGTACVGDILQSPERFHGTFCKHPDEPSYGGGNDRIARIDLKPGRPPRINSFAHGGTTFRLFSFLEVIRLRDGELPAVVDQAEKALARDGETFQRGGELVRVADGATMPLAPATLRDRLERRFRFEKYSLTAKKHVAKPCPPELALRLQANRGMWPNIPELRGLVCGPIMRQDGSLAAEAGYDPATKLLVLGDGSTCPAIPEKPSRDQIRAALASVLEPFGGYTLNRPQDRANLLALIFTVIQRPALGPCPAYSADASTAASGKTKLCQAAGWFGGMPTKASPWPREADEQRKNLIAALRYSPHALLFDNVERSLYSDVLCAVLTSEVIEDRVLGASERLAVPSNAVIMFSANNLEIMGDLSRRVLRINVDPGVERPHEREFSFDPVARVRERWLEKRAAALTVLRGYFAAGAPRHGRGGVGSFEQWDSVVRQAVCWLAHEDLCDHELADPVDSIKENFDSDPETRRLATMLTACHALFGSEGKRASDIAEWASYGSVVDDPEQQAAQEALKAVLPEIAPGFRQGDVNPGKLGYWFRRNKGRIIGGLCFEQGSNRGGSIAWMVRRAA